MRLRTTSVPAVVATLVAADIAGATPAGASPAVEVREDDGSTARTGPRAAQEPQPSSSEDVRMGDAWRALRAGGQG